MRAIAIVACLLTGTLAPTQARPGTPFRAWVSADGQLRLQVPSITRLTTSEAPLGALMTRGWRLVWDGRTDAPGRVFIRLTIPVVPASGQGRETELLEVGVGVGPAVLRSCLRFGLDGPNVRRLPDRTINGTCFSAWSNSDGGMSQAIVATDLRAVLHGRCDAVERLSYAEEAADPADPRPTLTERQGAALLDEALASLQL